jgi:hypothetical protein
MLRRANPVVATYARADWLDVRVTAVAEAPGDGVLPPVDRVPIRTAEAILDETVATLRDILADHVWAEGETTWADLVGAAADGAGVRLAVVEAGTTGTLAALLAEVQALERATSAGPGVAPDPTDWPVETAAAEAARDAGVAVGIALVARTLPGEGTLIRVGVVAPGVGVSRVLDLHLFQHSAHGRFRAAVAAAAFAIEILRTLDPARPPD